MESHRIAVISDTHGLLRAEVRERLLACEAILHGGDCGRPDILEQLNAIGKVYAVRGNVEKGGTENLPEELEFILFGFRIYMRHNRKQIRRDLQGIDIVICGHSHKYEKRREGGILYLNPGSCGPRRFRNPVTMMLLTLYPEKHLAETEKIVFTENISAASADEDAVAALDMHKLVKTIMKEVRGGRTVAEIAERNRVSEELAEQICRFYLTHPGVDVDGILDRMERKDL